MEPAKPTAEAVIQPPAAEDAGGEAEDQEPEPEDEEDDPASVQKLLESFSKEQLVELLRDAAVLDPNVLAKVRSAADADPVQRKIFVHGLGWDTTAESLTAVFHPFGEIEDLKVVTDRATGRCKGYAFILFRHRAGARRALKEPQKKIGNRMTACQLASVGPAAQGGAPAFPAATDTPASESTQRKIFISNVGPEIDPQKLLDFFAQYGEIEEGPLGLDKATGKPKGFALFIYKSIDSAKKSLEEPHKNFEGHVLHCQKAIDGPKANKSSPFSAKKPNLGSGVRLHQVPGVPGAGHLMAPSASGIAGHQAGVAAAAGLNPALGQALNAYLTAQGAGLGLFGANGAGSPAASGVGRGMQGGYGTAGFPGAYGTQGGAPQGGATWGFKGL